MHVNCLCFNIFCLIYLWCLNMFEILCDNLFYCFKMLKVLFLYRYHTLSDNYNRAIDFLLSECSVIFTEFVSCRYHQIRSISHLCQGYLWKIQEYILNFKRASCLPEPLFFPLKVCIFRTLLYRCMHFLEWRCLFCFKWFAEFYRVCISLWKLLT